MQWKLYSDKEVFKRYYFDAPNVEFIRNNENMKYEIIDSARHMYWGIKLAEDINLSVLYSGGDMDLRTMALLEYTTDKEIIQTQKGVQNNRWLEKLDKNTHDCNACK